MKEVLTFLNKNKWLYIPVIEALELGNAEVVAFDEDGAVVKQDGYLVNLCLTSDEALLKYSDLIRNNLCAIFGFKDLNKISGYFPGARQVPCYQMVYTKKEPPILKTNAEFRLLDESWAQFVFENYGNPNKPVERVAALLKRKYIFGVFVGGEIAGFCGRHEEGAMGLLHILPHFRRQGLGRVMEQFIIGEVLKEGRTPYGHIVFGNETSMNLQRSTDGVIILPEVMVWHACK